MRGLLVPVGGVSASASTGGRSRPVSSGQLHATAVPAAGALPVPTNP
ncbi:hypothetical protein BKA22_000891 [Cellulomonas soli]|nr:hypothetical protein [Cellulomonas soli]